MIIHHPIPTQSPPLKQTLHHKFTHLAKTRMKKQDHSQLFPKTEVQTIGHHQSIKQQGYRKGRNSHSRSQDRQYERLPEVGRKVTGTGNLYPMLLIRSKGNNSSATWQNFPPQGEERAKAISDFHPKLNKIKMKYLRSENRSCQPSIDKGPTKHRAGHQTIVRGANKNLRVNFSCQRITPLNNSQQISYSGKFRTEQGRSRGRYQQIPPEEFIYEGQSSLLGRGLVEKITRIMRKTRGELKLG